MKEAAIMADIVKMYRQELPAFRFIGKKYGDGERVNGGFGSQWGEWFQNGWFEALEKLPGGGEALCEDGSAYLGLMRSKEGEPFEYWIGMLLPAGTKVPEGYGYVDFPASAIGICWLKGPEYTLYCQEPRCCTALAENGYEPLAENDVWWFFERYACPRFTTPDENGEVILDIGFFVK